MSMIHLYFTLAFRAFMKHKGYSLINIGGLALGIASCLLILLYVTHEKNYNRWIRDHERIFRVAIDITTQNGEHLEFAPITPNAAQVLTGFTQTDAVCRIFQPSGSTGLVTNGNEKKYYESGIFWVDPNFFTVFSYPLLAGDTRTALDEPNTLVITRSIAIKYFGFKDNWGALLDQSLTLNDKSYRIKGILQDLPDPSTFKPDFIASLNEFSTREFMKNWHSTMFHTFLKLKPGTDIREFEVMIRDMANQYVGDEIRNNGQQYRFFLQSLDDIHLHSDLRYELSKNNKAAYLNIFFLAAVFILLIACFNFINLSTATARLRAKEIGIRKTTGAGRMQLMVQFFSETALICLLSLAVSILVISLVLPWFNAIAMKHITIADLLQPEFLVMAAAVVCLTTFLSGFYPAVVLSGFNPAAAFSSRFIQGKAKGESLRNAMVVGQFCISVLIIFSTLVMYRQVRYLQSRDLGFSQDQLLVIQAPGGGKLAGNFQVIRQELLKNPGVSAVSVTGNIPGRSLGNNLVAMKNDRSKSTDMMLLQIDDRFLNTYDIDLIAGRNISELIPEDTAGDVQNVLINEAALKSFGWSSPQEAISQEFGGGWGKVIGVTRNFNYTSLQTGVMPLELYFAPRNFKYVTVRLDAADVPGTLDLLKQSWTKLMPTHPFDYFFLDEEFSRQYVFENRMKKMFSAFSWIGIFIACLGLFGLTTFALHRRIKEIGVKKVLGASVMWITEELSLRFLKWVILATAFALPLGWWMMNQWLAGFAYRISINWWMVLTAGFFSFTVAAIPVVLLTLQAAKANPVKSLKTE